MYFSPQALRVFGISVASVTLLEVLTRIYNYTLYFSPDSLHVWMFKYLHPSRWSIHSYNNEYYLWGVLAIQLGVLVYILYTLFAKNKHPRLAFFISGLLLFSLNNFHMAGINSGDVFLYTLFILASIIHSHSKISYSLAVFQGAVLYVSSAYQKSLPVWFPEGDAVYFILSNSNFGTWFGKLLTQIPLVCSFLTYFTLIALYVGWIGFLVYDKRYIFRKTSFYVLTLLHFGLLVSMHIHYISLVMLAYISLFWIYKDHAESYKPQKMRLIYFAMHIIITGFLIFQALYNLHLLSKQFARESQILQTGSKITQLAGYKVGYNFFSLDPHEDYWFEVYELDFKRDLLRTRTESTGLLQKHPGSYLENVVSPRYNRLLYVANSNEYARELLLRYYCTHTQAMTVGITQMYKVQRKELINQENLETRTKSSYIQLCASK